MVLQLGPSFLERCRACWGPPLPHKFYFPGLLRVMGLLSPPLVKVGSLVQWDAVGTRHPVTSEDGAGVSNPARAQKAMCSVRRDGWPWVKPALAVTGLGGCSTLGAEPASGLAAWALLGSSAGLTWYPEFAVSLHCATCWLAVGWQCPTGWPEPGLGCWPSPAGRCSAQRPQHEGLHAPFHSHVPISTRHPHVLP